jgi:hypothetical protein
VREGIEAIHKKLVEFGYNGLTVEEVENTYIRWSNGVAAQSVIDLFAFEDFDKHPRIFGNKEMAA